MSELKKRLGINDERYGTMIQVKEDYLEGRISLEEGNRILREKIGTCTPDEFAYGEQQLKGSYTDEVVVDRMDDLLKLFEGVLIRSDNVYPVNHPLWVYEQELQAMDKVLDEAEKLLAAPQFIKNPWLGIYDELSSWRIHLSRKQNQLYPMLEKYGFDRPTKIMWTFDDNVRNQISAASASLQDADQDEGKAFLALQPQVIEDVRDLVGKEREVLLPTAYKLLSEADFEAMSRSDHEIGYALIPAPGLYKSAEAQSEEGTTDKLQQGAAQAAENLNAVNGILDVATGKLTLEQINLLFRHMPVDLSYVDENELVKFYSDTEHRIFPRSASVIGREVRNCHPAKSVHVVEEIIEKFRSGEESRAEFWINKPGMFIYVLYTAVRDKDGKFRGVLEMMQDCTHIRELQGSQTLLTWDGTYDQTASGADNQADAASSDRAVAGASDKTAPAADNKGGTSAGSEDAPEEPARFDSEGGLVLDEKTTIGQVLKQYPAVIDFLPTLNPKLEKLKSPMGKIMAKIATLGMVSEHAGIPLEQLLDKLQEFIHSLDKK